MTVIRLAIKSLANRWLTAALTVFAIAISVMLLLGIEKLRHSAKASFANTVSGVDLVVGARTGNIQLILNAVFQIGNPVANMSWKSFQAVSERKDVAWAVPILLGDSHRGHRVVGTSAEFFDRYRFRGERQLEFRNGNVFSKVFEVVIGAEVAERFDYAVGGKITLSHGTGPISTAEHDDMPFVISGVLERTGTPLDKSLFVSPAAIEAIHINWKDGLPIQGRSAPTQAVIETMADKLIPTSISAAFVGLTSPIQTFEVQRFVNRYRREALTAAMPALTLYEMWGLVGTAETALLLIAAMVVITSLVGMVTMILATLSERRRELAILRAMGAGPRTVLGLVLSESTILAALGVLLGVGATYIALYLVRPVIDRAYGLSLDVTAPTTTELMILGAIILGGALAGLVPAMRAYAMSLADGMNVRN